MSLKTALERIMNEWRVARTERFAQHPLASFIRGDATKEVELALASRRGLSVKGSPGAGQWAAVPWISVFDDIVTDSATHGYYVVYLFHSYPPARCTQSSAVRAPEVGEHICRKYFIEIRTMELENVQIRH